MKKFFAQIKKRKNRPEILSLNNFNYEQQQHNFLTKGIIAPFTQFIANNDRKRIIAGDFNLDNKKSLNS